MKMRVHVKAPLTDSQRSVAAIVYPARAMTGLRHVVVPADADATTMCEEDRALCGVNVDGWYMEHKDFDPKTIGCRRCRKAWDPVGEPVPSTRAASSVRGRSGSTGAARSPGACVRTV